VQNRRHPRNVSLLVENRHPAQLSTESMWMRPLEPHDYLVYGLHPAYTRLIGQLDLLDFRLESAPVCV
jgi:hypothetical protein